MGTKRSTSVVESFSGAERIPPRRGTERVTEARSSAQRAKLDTQKQERIRQKSVSPVQSQARGANSQNTPHTVTFNDAMESYLQDHEGGNHSSKTLEWHRTALGLLRTYLEQECEITLIREIEASAISGWFAHMRKKPGKRGKVRSERTIQTYARSARAFFHWLMRRDMVERNVFDQVTFPKVGRPLIQTITAEEFEHLLKACTPPNESGPFAERAAVRNRAILWLFYDTGIRVSELCNLSLNALDRKHGVITVKGKGSKERRIALGNVCQRHMYYYLDRHRPDTDELSEWGSPNEDHLFLSETRSQLTKNGVEMLFKRLRQRAGITNKRVSPHILRHTFAIRYLKLGNDPFSLQELLGHEDMTTVKLYMHMNDDDIQEQKRKYSPGDHLPPHIPGNQQERRRGFRVVEKEKKK